MSERAFKLVSAYRPQGDQPRAIDEISNGVIRGEKDQVLLGVTGSGKTFTMANVIARTQRPALVIAHNKTLAAQLYAEFRELFPDNAVEYFVSYYDYYQPESYLPNSDTYIEKDADINERIDKLRLEATTQLCQRRDVIVVASVSCIYGIGAPDSYSGMHAFVRRGARIERDDFLMKLTEIQYARNNFDFKRKTFRVSGDVVDVFPAHEDARAIRIEFFGDEIEALYHFDPLTGARLEDLDEVHIFPSSHYVTARDRLKTALAAIERELAERVEYFGSKGMLVEAQRIRQRTMYDMEMLSEVGTVKGIENYSRHLSGRAPGEPPATLIDYFPRDFLTFIDESHQTIPQITGMYRGDFARKRNLVDYGFRLPSAFDNRPLRYEEFRAAVNQVVCVSATPGPVELELTRGVVTEQVIRPTGLIDPRIETRPAKNQVDDLLREIRATIAQGHRALVATLTKRMAEELAVYFRENDIKVTYLHSEIETIERTEIIRDLRLGVFDVLVGINLLREGLDMPEVALVAVLDADKEGFLRSATSLIQTCGRAARNVDGRVILYADKITRSIAETIDETTRRRTVQEKYNAAHGITAESIKKDIKNILASVCEADYADVPIDDDEAWKPGKGRKKKRGSATRTMKEIELERKRIEKSMQQAAKELKFELAAELRDRLFELEKKELRLAGE